MNSTFETATKGMSPELKRLLAIAKGEQMDRSYQLENGNMNRDDWEFEYTASTLAAAAKAQRDHRTSRVAAWEAKKAETMAKIKESGLTVDESMAESMTNYTTSAAGRGAQIMVDTTLQRDLTECVSKIRTHRAAATEYDAWAQVLDANPEARLKLKHNDWQFFFGK